MTVTSNNSIQPEGRFLPRPSRNVTALFDAVHADAFFCTIARVRYVALIGQANCGKATRLRSIGGALLPDNFEDLLAI